MYGKVFQAVKIKETVQVFMVSSIFSKYKDIIRIIPVLNMTSEKLNQLCKNVILKIEKI